jgi:hypothetical protein
MIETRRTENGCAEFAVSVWNVLLVKFQTMEYKSKPNIKDVQKC